MPKGGGDGSAVMHACCLIVRIRDSVQALTTQAELRRTQATLGPQNPVPLSGLQNLPHNSALLRGTGIATICTGACVNNPFPTYKSIKGIFFETRFKEFKFFI